MNTPLKLAFYKGRGTITDRLIRTVTRSQFSHVELVRGDAVLGQEARCLSASYRDGGVRFKIIRLAPGRWVLRDVDGWACPERVWNRAAARIGAEYDLAGIALTFALPIRRETPGKWFCSELCADALGLPRPHTIAPGDLFDWAARMNAAFLAGRDQRPGIREDGRPPGAASA